MEGENKEKKIEKKHTRTELQRYLGRFSTPMVARDIEALQLMDNPTSLRYIVWIYRWDIYTVGIHSWDSSLGYIVGIHRWNRSLGYIVGIDHWDGLGLYVFYYIVLNKYSLKHLKYMGLLI